MKMRLYAAVLCFSLLLSPILTSTASAHWEFHDVNGQYLFGYTGVESAYEYESEVAHAESVVLTGDRALARTYLDAGALFVAVGTDIGVLRTGAKDLRQAFKP